MNINYRKREIFLLRFSGWFCLLPATVYLYFYQMTNSLFCLGELVIIVLFAVYLLTTAKSKRWLNPQNVMKLTIFALIFVAIIIFIPLYLKRLLEGEKMENKTKVDSRGKRIGMFVLKTLVYFGILMALIYLYEYSGLTSVHFIYNEF